MSITKKISLVILSLVAIFSLALSASAQATEAVNKLESADCFEPGLYKFQSVQVSAGPTALSYKPGDTITFSGEAINENPYPVVDGNVFVRIGKVNPDYFKEGQDAIDDFIALSDISLDASSSKTINFSWKIPAGLGGGNYQADYFFSVGKKFNLGGLPFTNEIIIGLSYFTIKSDNVTNLAFDRASTKVNGVKYDHVNEWPRVNKDSSISITQPLKNFSNKSLNISLTYDLYFWDSLNEKDKISTKTETVTIPAGQTKILEYVIPKAERSVYYLRLKAVSGDLSSLVNIRVMADNTEMRINYPAITSFPVLANQEFKIFSCYHNTVGESQAKIQLSLKDKSGKEVMTVQKDITSNTDMSAVMSKLSLNKSYDYLKLEAKLFDKDNKMVDSYDNIYDCQKINPSSCFQSGGAVNYWLLGSLILLILVLVIMIMISKNNSKRKYLIIVLVALIFILGLYFYFNNIKQVSATEVSSNYGLTKNISQTRNFQYYGSMWGDEVRYITGGDKRIMDTVNPAGIIFKKLTNLSQITITSGATIQHNPSVPLGIGESFTFSTSTICAFTTTGGGWDTPFCTNPSGSSYQKFGSDDLRYGRIKWTVEDATPYAESSDLSVLSCSGLSCTAIAGGTASVRVVFPNTLATPDIAFRTHYLMKSTLPYGDPLTYGYNGTVGTTMCSESNCGPYDGTVNPAVSNGSRFYNIKNEDRDLSDFSTSTIAHLVAVLYLDNTSHVRYLSDIRNQNPNLIRTLDFDQVETSPWTITVNATCNPANTLAYFYPTGIIISNNSNHTFDFGEDLTVGKVSYRWTDNFTSCDAVRRFGLGGDNVLSIPVSGGQDVSSTLDLIEDVIMPNIIADKLTFYISSGGGSCDGVNVSNLEVYGCPATTPPPPLPPSGNLSGSCSAFPSSIMVGSSTVWTAYPTGGTGPYTYFWLNSLGTSNPTNPVTYNATGTKTVLVTITDHVSSSTVKICSVQVNDIPPDQDQTLADCTQLTVNPSGALVNVNTLTTWDATGVSSCTSCPKTWTITEGGNTTTSPETSSTLNNIFTTVGLKEVRFTIASTTLNKYGTCTATTTIVQTGGGTHEI